MRVISKTGATSVTDPETGTEYQAGDDGVFELPEPVGQHLATKHASVWCSEAQHKAAARAALVEELRNPNVLSTVVAELRERVVDLEAQVAAHEAKLSAKSTRTGKGSAKEPETVEPAPAEQPPAPETAKGDGDGETPTSPDSTVAAEPESATPPTEAKTAQARKTTSKKTTAPKPATE